VSALRWGILSTAAIGDRIVEAARHTPLAEVVAVGGRDRARAEAWAAQRGVPRAHGSYEALLADPEVDAVYVALPNALHAEWAARAARAGKHVLCEKPLGLRPEPVARAFDAAQAAGTVLTEAFMWRHLPQTARVRELLAEGAVGEVRLARASFSFTLHREADVRLDPELGGGALLDVGCYCVSALRLVAGAEPVRASAERLAGPTGIDLRHTGSLRFADGLLGLLDCGFDLPDRRGLEVVGAEGVLLVADPWIAARPRVELRRGSRTEVEELPWADAYRLELEDVAHAAAGERAPLLGRDDALGQARALAALHRAAVEGAVVDV
jgi:predicted dehydrogenase